MKLNTSDSTPLQRLLRPRSIAVIGGEFARRSVFQCDRLGYEGEIWPVNPVRETMESRPCFRTVSDLPGVPDAAFVAIPRQATVETVAQLAQLGTGGVVCYAAGFAEVGEYGRQLQDRLVRAAGDMALVGPNCYGMLNYLDGVALWPDQQGGKRCRRGVAIVSQSGNITISLSMQRRGLPLAYLISTGNMAGVKTHDYIRTMLHNPDITAIGLYLEQIPDPVALSKTAIEALNAGKPIVVLVSGQSDKGADITLSHSHSMSGDASLNDAFFDKYGMIKVHSIPQLLETLKYVSILTPSTENTIASVSCSGGEAALMADLGNRFELEFTDYSTEQKQRLKQVLGDRVSISNPLDYHTYIWGKKQAQESCFQAVFDGDQNVKVMVIDYPAPGLCDTGEWDTAVEAIIEAKNRSEARVVVVSTMHENFPSQTQQLLIDSGIAPMLGMQECICAVAGSIRYARRRDNAQHIQPLTDYRFVSSNEVNLKEYDAKEVLRNFGISSVQGTVIRDAQSVDDIVDRFGFPLVAKISSVEQIHKSELGGVILNIRSKQQLVDALEQLFKLSEEILVEPMARPPLVEMIVGIRRHCQFGYVVVLGSGGYFAEIIGDKKILLLPIDNDEINTAFEDLKVGQLLTGFRNVQGDAKGVVELLHRLIEFVVESNGAICEIEINPLFVYAKGDGVLAVDAVMRRTEQERREEGDISSASQCT